ncbi:MAG: hypothetical protein U0165_04260 [Polyangiaceae bacterium]
MHIGGGKNDAGEKEPIRRSVEPHFDLFKRCFAMVEDPKLPLDVSTDLFIERTGGKAKVKKMSTAAKSKPFQECVAQAFESIDFLKPATGTTNVSYSLRFSR